MLSLFLSLLMSLFCFSAIRRQALFFFFFFFFIAAIRHAFATPLICCYLPSLSYALTIFPAMPLPFFVYATADAIATADFCYHCCRRFSPLLMLFRCFADACCCRHVFPAITDMLTPAFRLLIFRHAAFSLPLYTLLPFSLFDFFSPDNVLRPPAAYVAAAFHAFAIFARHAALCYACC